jgi:hypothetical protein
MLLLVAMITICWLIVSPKSEEDEDPVEQAMEWVNYNIVGAYVGKFTPMIVYKNEEGEYSSE